MSSPHTGHSSGGSPGHDLTSPSQHRDSELLHRLADDEQSRATTINLLKALRRKSAGGEELMQEIDAVAGKSPSRSPQLVSSTGAVAGGLSRAPSMRSMGSTGSATSGAPSSVSAAPTLTATAISEHLPPVVALEQQQQARQTSAGSSASGPSQQQVQAPLSLPAATIPITAPPVAVVPSSVTGKAADIIVEEVDVRSQAAFQRVSIVGPAVLSGEQREACKMLKRALELREKHCYIKPAYYWGPYAPEQFPFSPKAKGSSTGGVLAGGSQQKGGQNIASHATGGPKGTAGRIARRESDAAGSAVPKPSSSPPTVAAGGSSNSSAAGSAGGSLTIQPPPPPSPGKIVGNSGPASSGTNAGATANAITPGRSPKVLGTGSTTKGGASSVTTGNSPQSPDHRQQQQQQHAGSDGFSGSSSASNASANSAHSLPPSHPNTTTAGHHHHHHHHNQHHTPGTGGGVGAAAPAGNTGSSSSNAAGNPLVTPTLTGLVASSEAAVSALPPNMFQGSNLVTLETGKDYGNLFHRRRLEPAFKPFSIPLNQALDNVVHRWKDGVMEVVLVPPPSHSSSSSDAMPLSAGKLARLKSQAARGARDRSSSNVSGSGGLTAFATSHGPHGSSSGESASGGGMTIEHEAMPSREYMEEEYLESAAMLAEALEHNNKLLQQAKEDAASKGISLFSVPSFAEYHADYHELCKIVHTAFVKSFAYRRLELLEARFHLHKQLNAERELMESKTVPHRDFYNVRKVDTHVHHSACMNQKHLLNFIKMKLKTCPDEVVIERDGKALTLKQVFESLNLTAYDLSVDTLDVHAHDTFHRFDRFNLKYNPVGQSRLREIFLKTDNYVNGRYLAEVTREVFEDLETAKYTLAEYRLSIYGRSKDEWRKLAAWVVDHSLASPNVRWMIQIPRLYEIYRETKAVSCFQDMLANIFEPLFEVTRDPLVDPKLHQFLGLIVGFDSVDDESKQEIMRDVADVAYPDKWNFSHQPPYYYWNYFLAANCAVLNKYRASRGMSQISFRPHSGEAGDVDHLAATFLTAESVNHGVNLRKSPALQYLYYLANIGLAVSPLSNNKLFVEYNKNPFYEFFAKGMNVSLSTDDPLILSYTREPLIEEYCVAAQVWKLAAVDMCEIARNSVLQSGFEYPYKAHYIGPDYAELGPEGNDIHLSNVPYIRLQYRKETLLMERGLIEEGAGTLMVSAPPTPPASTSLTTHAAGFGGGQHSAAASAVAVNIHPSLQLQAGAGGAIWPSNLLVKQSQEQHLQFMQLQSQLFGARTEAGADALLHTGPPPGWQYGGAQQQLLANQSTVTGVPFSSYSFQTGSGGSSTAATSMLPASQAHAQMSARGFRGSLFNAITGNAAAAAAQQNGPSGGPIPQASPPGFKAEQQQQQQSGKPLFAATAAAPDAVPALPPSLSSGGSTFSGMSGPSGGSGGSAASLPPSSTGSASSAQQQHHQQQHHFVVGPNAGAVPTGAGPSSVPSMTMPSIPESNSDQEANTPAAAGAAGGSTPGIASNTSITSSPPNAGSLNTSANIVDHVILIADPHPRRAMLHMDSPLSGDMTGGILMNAPRDSYNNNDDDEAEEQQAAEDERMARAAAAIQQNNDSIEASEAAREAAEVLAAAAESGGAVPAGSPMSATLRAAASGFQQHHHAPEPGRLDPRHHAQLAAQVRQQMMGGQGGEE
jgi:AMP deaminase